MGIYNCADTLSEAIDSIINQTYENWELILCNDASTDETYNVALSYRNKYPNKIILISNEKNQRLASSLNNCLKYVTGDYIARMDGDDIAVLNRFEKQVEFLNEHQEFDLVGTQMMSFDETGDIGVVQIGECPNKYSMRFNTPFCHATIMARKEVYDKLNGYTVSKETKRCEDTELWFRFFKENFKGYNLQEPLYKVRERHEDYKRRTFKDSYNVVKVCYKGYQLLDYPLRYYICLLKPLITGMVPSFVMKKIHDFKRK